MAMPSRWRMPLEKPRRAGGRRSRPGPRAGTTAAVLVLGDVFAPAELREELHVLPGGEVAVQHHVLGDVGHVLLGLQRVLLHVDAVDRHGARRRLGEAEDQHDRGRLARAVAPSRTKISPAATLGRGRPPPTVPSS